MRQELHPAVALALIWLKTHWQTAECSSNLRCATQGGVDRMGWTHGIMPEQETTAKDKQSKNYWGPSPRENCSHPTAINHHRTLRVPVSWRILRELATEAHPSCRQCRSAHPLTDWLKASNYLNI